MNEYILSNFHNRYCYKFISKRDNTCACGKPKQVHSDFPSTEDKWSLANNTKLKPCETFGSILFTGYDNVSVVNTPKFISFNCENELSIEEKIFKLLQSYWGFKSPKLIISINGSNKNMQFKNFQQKKNFKQGLIEVMKTDTTWIFGGGFNIGIHKLISEAVQEFRLFHHGHENAVNLIGISTWGVVLNYENLITDKVIGSEECIDNTTREYTYENSYENIKGTVCLNPHYDGFLFCDDGTEKQYDKETVFRREFENFVRKKVNAFAVQILYEGGVRALESAYNSLTAFVPLVVIKESGRSADIICRVMELQNNEKIKNKILKILEEYNKSLKLNNDFKKFETYLFEMRTKYKRIIIIHDMLNPAMKLDKNILKAIVSSRFDTTAEQMLELTIRFDCHDLADTNVFQTSKYSDLSQNIRAREFKKALMQNKPEFVQLFLENYFDIESFLQKEVLIELYQTSMPSNRYLSLDEDQLCLLREGKCDEFLYAISEIIQDLSGNILIQKKIFADFDSEDPIISARKICITPLADENYNTLNKQNVGNKNSKAKMKTTYLFLWALLSGYLDLAEKFWRIGDDHISSALMSSIILINMRNRVLKAGDSEISEKLLAASNKFQEMASSIVNEGFGKKQKVTYDILIRALTRWDNMSCLQIAISGKLLDFLYISACQSYTKKAWMGKLSPSLPMWKILIAIPFSLIVIKPFLNRSPSKMKVIRHKKSKPLIQPECQCINLQSFNNNLLQTTPNETHLSKKSTFFRDIKRFYLAPKVKFVIYLISYVIFLMVFSYLNLVKMKPLDDMKNLREFSVEFFVYINIFSIFIEEIRQIFDQERRGITHKLTSYFSGAWNRFDMIILLLFLISAAARFLLSSSNFIFVQCLFAVTFSMFCLRTMQFYLISPSLGPKVIMIRKMIFDILFFLSIFVLFIISYGTLVQTLQNEHNKMSLSLIKDIFYRPYFQTYGELMLDEFKVPSSCNTTICITKYTTMISAFVVFLLLSNILLINLLIAMFGHTFNKIQDESGKYFAFTQIQLVEEFYQKPILPPPLNFFYYLILGILYFNKLIFRMDYTNPIDSFLVKKLSYEENIRMSRFEEVCMESSMIKMQTRKDNQTNSSSSTKIFMDYLERLGENQNRMTCDIRKLQKIHDK